MIIDVGFILKIYGLYFLIFDQECFISVKPEDITSLVTFFIRFAVKYFGKLPLGLHSTAN